MASEECAYCGEAGTPWSEIKGHLCFDCHCESNHKRYKRIPGDILDEYMESKL